MRKKRKVRNCVAEVFSYTRLRVCGYRRERYDKSAGPERAGGGSLVVTSGVEFNTSTASRMQILEDAPWIRGESYC